MMGEKGCDPPTYQYPLFVKFPLFIAWLLALRRGALIISSAYFLYSLCHHIYLSYLYHVVGSLSLHSLAGAAIGGGSLSFWILQMFFSTQCLVTRLFASMLLKRQMSTRQLCVITNTQWHALYTLWALPIECTKIHCDISFWPWRCGQLVYIVFALV
jgi:hypothetical protein